MENNYSYLDRNISAVRERIKEACAKAGRDGEDLLFLAAIKSADVSEINYITESLGVKAVGENRVQQLTARYDEIKRDGVSLHFIGKLQRNKVKYIIDKVDMIHSVDTAALASEISSRASRIGRVIDVLVEINIGREEGKSGVMPSEAEDLARQVASLEGVRLCGFMTMAPVCETVGEYRRYFSEMRELSQRIWTEALGRSEGPELSMGMSGSFEAAILEGATMVRIGRCLFEK